MESEDELCRALQSGSVRPERVDVAHYRSLTSEWQISGIGRRLQELYRQGFGTVFHASASASRQKRVSGVLDSRQASTALVCQSMTATR